MTFSMTFAMRWGKQDDPLFQCSQYRYQGTPCPLNPQVLTNAFHPTCWLWRVSRTFSYLWDTNEASEQIHESSSWRHFRFTFSTIFIEMSLHNLAVVTFLIFAGKKWWHNFLSEEYLHKKEKVIFKSPRTGKKADATLQKDPHQVVYKEFQMPSQASG